MSGFDHSNYGEYEGVAAEVLADFDTRKIITRFLDPDTEEMLVEIHLDPDIARDFAFNLTRASIAVEDTH